MTTPTSALPVLLLALASAAAAAGSPNNDSAADVIARLDSEDLALREAASDALRRRLEADATEARRQEARAFEGELVEALRTLDLSLEQRVRVLDALRGRFVRSPRAAIGIRFANVPTIDGVELQQVLDGFPAKDLGLLKAGDVLTTVAGVSLVDPGVRFNQAGPLTQVQSRLREVIFSHDPGDVVEMTLLRRLIRAPEAAAPPAEDGTNRLVADGPGKNAEAITVHVPLGSFQDLRDAMIDPATLESAWRHRTRRLGIPGVEARALASPLSGREMRDRGRGAPPASRPPRLLGARPGRAGAAEVILARGSHALGQPEPAVILVGGERQVFPLRNAGGVPVLDLRQVAKPQPGGNVRANRGQPVEEFADLFQQIALMTNRLEMLQRRAADPALTEAQRAAAAADAKRTARAIEVANEFLQQQVRRAQAEQQERERQDGQPRR